MSKAHTSGTRLLLQAPVTYVLWRLAAPNVLAVSMMTAVTFADAWYVGQLGTAALASLALAFPFLTLMQMMAGGAIGGGITSAVARALGAGDIARAESTAWHALLIAIVMSAIYMIGLGLFAPPIFRLLGGQGAALVGALQYAQIIFGGAATAMVVCQGLAAAYLALHLFGGHGRLRLHPLALRWAPVSDIMRVGGLGLIHSICMAMTVVVVTGLVGQYGTEALAGYGLGARLELMLVPIAFGVGAALTAAVGANVGARQFAHARRIAWTGAGVTLLLTGVLGIGTAAMPGLWLDYFTSDPEAYTFGARYLTIAAPFYGIFGAGQALYFASQGTGRMVLPVAVTVVRFGTIAAIGALAVSLAWDIDALFIAVAIGLTIVGVGQALCIFGPGWRPAAAGL